MKVAVYGKMFAEAHLPAIKELLIRLQEIGAHLLVYRPFLGLLGDKVKFVNGVEEFEKYEDIKDNANLLISIGGDGTLLGTIGLVRDSGIPVVGFNTGRLGFLSSIAREDIAHAIEEIAKGNYSLDKRTLLQLDTVSGLFGELNFALNEVTIHRKDTSSMIIIHAYTDDEYLNSYWADGLIVATPTGSTAYSMSCGGPIITPDSGNIILTPVSPHNLTVRPIVIPDTKVIKLKVDEREDTLLVSLDSRSETIDSTVELTIRKAPFTLNLLRLHGHGFLTTLRSKLMWGIDKRKG